MSNSILSSEGKAPFDVPQAGKDCHTWYKIFGELSSEAIPLIGLHGGPGAGHEYLLCLEDLYSKYNIPVVLYDQIGCGQSTALPEKKGDSAFWTVDLFEKELSNLVMHLGISRFDVFGHSWGGMLASMYASKRPSGLRKLILMGSPASVDLVLQGSAELRTQLSAATQRVLQEHEAVLDLHASAYKEACMEFYQRFLCRCDPWPPELVTSMGHLEEDPTVYETMYGPSELICTGSLKGWTAIPHAHRIQNTTLIINGEFDETVDFAIEPFFEEIPRAKWITLKGASHMGLWEQRERFMKVVSRFLVLSAPEYDSWIDEAEECVLPGRVRLPAVADYVIEVARLKLPWKSDERGSAFD